MLAIKVETCAWRRTVVATLAVAFAVMTTGCQQQTTPAVAAAEPSSKVVIDWNLNAVTAVRSSSPTKFQSEGLIYMSYVQAAVYDAVTTISARYTPYHPFKADSKGASLEAAVTSAAYNSLLAYLGDPDGKLKTKYDAGLAALPDKGKAAGVAVGKAAADDIVAFRTDDGRNVPVTMPYGTGPLAAGRWVFAPPPSLQSAQTPWVGFMRPFTLKSSSQFRIAGPPALSSPAWVGEFNEVKAYGALNSSIRTADQTAVAQFWNANAINQVNQAFSDLAQRRGMRLMEAARLLAMANLVGSDAAIACWDSKYDYTFWRPVTAIRNAGIAGNPATEADTGWSPLITTPNHPEYPAAHGCLTSAEAEVFSVALNTQRINVDIPGASGGATTLTDSRHFATAGDMRQEIVNARVWGGLHYRGSAEAGVKLGQNVAQWSLRRYFQPKS